MAGHWTWSPRMQALAEAEAIEAYTLPAGAIMLLLREIGAGRPGLTIHVGLGTFADPRHGGGACNQRALAAKQPRTELISVGGRELLRYLPLRIDSPSSGAALPTPRAMSAWSTRRPISTWLPHRWPATTAAARSWCKSAASSRAAPCPRGRLPCRGF